MMLGSFSVLHESLQLFAIIPVAWGILRWLQTRNVHYHMLPARVFRRRSVTDTEPSALTLFSRRVREALLPEEEEADQSSLPVSSQSGSSSSSR